MDAGNHDALSESWKPQAGAFERTYDGLLGVFMRRLPPQPAGQRQLRTSWTDTLYYSSWHTVAVAVGMLAGVATAIAALRHFTVMRISVLSFGFGLVRFVSEGLNGAQTFAPPVPSDDGANGGGPPLWLQLVGSCVVVFFAQFFLRKIPEFALKEEQEFREGCENWSGRQRVRSCALFGIAHLNNLWYPIASVVALAFGGGIFMWRYLLEYRQSNDRERASRCAAALHAVYNGLAVCIIAPLILAAIWYRP